MSEKSVSNCNFNSKTDQCVFKDKPRLGGYHVYQNNTKILKTLMHSKKSYYRTFKKNVLQVHKITCFILFIIYFVGILIQIHFLVHFFRYFCTYVRAVHPFTGYTCFFTQYIWLYLYFSSHPRLLAQ